MRGGAIARSGAFDPGSSPKSARPVPLPLGKRKAMVRALEAQCRAGFHQAAASGGVAIINA